MSVYSAPLKDMHFALHEIAGLREVLSLPGWQEVTPELVDEVLAQAGKFAQEVLDPLNRVGDEIGAKHSNGVVTPPEGYRAAYRKFIEAGWNGVAADPEYGG